MASGSAWTIAGTIAALLLAAGCEPEPTSVGAEASEPAPPLARAWVAPPTFGLTGCDALFDDGGCLRASAQPLGLWLPGAWTVDEIVVRLDGRPLLAPRVEGRASERGLMIRVPELPVVGRVTVEHRGDRLVELELEPMPSAYVEVLGLAAEPELARRRLHEHRGRAGGRVAILLDYLDLRLALAEADPSAATMLGRMARRAAMLGERRGVAQLHVHAAELALRASDYNLATDALGEARRIALRSPDVLVDADQLEANVLRRLGKLELALGLLDNAAGLAADIRLGEGPRSWDVPAILAVTRAQILADMGRFAEADREASRAIVELRGREDGPAASIRNNAAWIRILRREDDPNAADPVAEIAALAANDPRPTTWLNLAIASSRVARWDQAEQALARLDPERLGDRNAIWYELAASRVVVGRARPGEQRGAWREARARLARAAAAADRTREVEPALRVRLEQAELELAAGQRGAARAHFEAAERLADGIALGIDGASGRSLFSTSRSRSRSRYVELLLELDDRPAALCSALGSRARHLRALAAGGRAGDANDPVGRTHRAKLSEYHRRKAALIERERGAWKLSAAARRHEAEASASESLALDEQLRELRRAIESNADLGPWDCRAVRPAEPGQGLLTMIHDARDEGWYFLLDRVAAIDVVHVARSPGQSVEASARAALDALAGQLAELDELEVVAIGEFAGLDFQALAPASLPVVHGLGLGPASPRAWQARASVHAGAGGLQHAEREASVVRRALVDAGWQLAPWQPRGSDELDLLHFAGHGTWAGTSGWRSALQLGPGDWLTSGELIAAQHAPRFVLLSACTAGMTSPDTIDGGMNMAVAFLLAGAELVIAPDHEVDDAAALQLAERLYEALPRAEQGDELADRWRAELREATGDPRHRGWRMWVR